MKIEVWPHVTVYQAPNGKLLLYCEMCGADEPVGGMGPIPDWQAMSVLNQIKTRTAAFNFYHRHGAGMSGTSG